MDERGGIGLHDRLLTKAFLFIIVYIKSAVRAEKDRPFHKMEGIDGDDFPFIFYG